MMHNWMSLALSAPLVLLAPAGHCADDAPAALFHLAVKNVPAENGKVLTMEFFETARIEASSTVLVKRTSGGSVSSSLFVLRGMCGLARARGKQNFLPEQVAGDPGRYIVTFPDTAPPKDKGFSMEQCNLIGY